MSSAFGLKIGEDTELRVLEERHSGTFYAAVAADRERLGEWLLWASGMDSEQDARDFIRTYLRRFADGDGLMAGIWRGGELAGGVLYRGIDWATRSTEVGYWVHAPFAGRGLATEACRAMVEHAFGELGLLRVEIHCATGNAASRAVPERLGFVLEGTLRRSEFRRDELVDAAVYGMLSEEWRARRSSEGPREAKAPSSSGEERYDYRAPRAIFLRPGGGEMLDYGDGDTSLVLASGEEAGGAFSVVEHRLSPGAEGPPPHYHERMLDAFYVLEGTLTVHVGDHKEVAPARSFACFPPGGIHTFSNPGEEPVRVINVNAPGGWDRVLRALAREVGASGTGGSAAVSRIASEHDMVVADPG